MKVSISSILLVLLAIAASAASCSAAAQFERRPSLVVHPARELNNKIYKRNDATQRALDLRGGGVLGTPVR